MQEETKQEMIRQAKWLAGGACVGLAIGAIWALRFGKIETIMVFPTKEVYDGIWDTMTTHGDAVADGGSLVVTEGRKMLLTPDGVLSAK